MTDKELVNELQNIATVMQVVGDLRKAKILTDAVALIDRLTTERNQTVRKLSTLELAKIQGLPNESEGG